MAHMPNFIIVGAAKSGTTTLHRLLNQHPNIFLPDTKEPHYFCRDKQFNFPVTSTRKEYLKLFSNHAEPALGEASTAYLYFRDCPTKIHAEIPDCKIICLIRNPTDRALSMWGHQVREGLEQDTLEKAIQDELSGTTRLRNGVEFGFNYCRLGLIADQIERFQTLFGRTNVLLLDYRQLSSDPQGLVDQVCRFLGVDTYSLPVSNARLNASGVPKFGWLHTFLNSQHPIKRALIFPAKILLPSNLRHSLWLTLRNQNILNGQKHVLPSSVKRQLDEYFKSETQRIGELLRASQMTHSRDGHQHCAQVAGAMLKSTNDARALDITFSVVIPVFNKARTLRRAVISVLDQVQIPPNNVEIILIDDGSDDDSVTRITKLQTEFSNRRIRLHCQKNMGASMARNTGVSLACHRYIAFLDADDSYKPQFLATIRGLITQFPDSGAFATSYEFVWQATGERRAARLRALTASKPQILDNYFSSSSQGDLPFNTSSICVQRDIFNRLGGFPVGENMGEDQSLICELALTHDIAYSPEPCAHYFQEVEGSLMQTEPALEEMPYSRRLQAKLDNQRIPIDRIPGVRAYISCHLLDLVRRNLRSGNLSAAHQLLIDSRSKIVRLKWCYWKLQYSVQAIKSRYPTKA